MPEKACELENGEEIVITGMSGQFPNSKNVKEFEYNLYNKINMLDDLETRWKHVYPGVPKVQGKIPCLSKFDATFFGINQIQADNMDIQMRMIIEESYKAILDAGVNPSNLRNSNTGVFIAACSTEADTFLMYNENARNGFGLLGANKAMLANRISFVLGLNGPSMLCDTACSSSMYALDLAYQHMKNGKIDAAIVGGTNILLCPYITEKFAKLGVLSLSGNNRPFDEDANGYVRSEAVSCVFIQRRKDARRIYASLIKSATNCDGFKAEGITFPSGNMQAKLLQQFYDELDVDLNNLGFMEAHSTGTVAGDPEECKAIDQVICKKRNKPLLIGSVKSNCGHSEASSGIVSLTKVLLTLNNNCIPPNVNFSKPRKTISSITEGRLVVVVEKTVLKSPFICINSFGFGGANAHALLKQNTLEHVVPSYGNENDLPYLFTWLDRTEANTHAIFDYFESRPLNIEHLALIRSSQQGGIKGMIYRGYNVLKPSSSTILKPESLSKNVQYNEGIKSSITWVFSGMGSQWVGMGRDLMKLKICSESILGSHQILKSRGFDLMNILNSDDPTTYENILNSFVGITAIQIALVDLLLALGMQPDFLIGHSLGEIACAYADGCATAEQAILASYYRGKVSTEVKTIRGSMAAVGVCYKDIKNILPPSIEAACHNSNESSTISGPFEDVASFSEHLKSRNIFVKEVPCSNIAFHSQYIDHFGPELMKYLKDIIPKPKLRSPRWISTCYPSVNWKNQESKFFSSEYNIKNLLSTVLFEEGAAYLPKNSITIEIAPHALLQSIIKSCCPSSTIIGLARRNRRDNILQLLDSLGRLYVNGCELNLEKLYPTIQWPVSRGTPTISDLIQFDHGKDYSVFRFEDQCVSTGNKFVTVLPSSEHKFLLGHEIDGRPLIPATFYLESVWRTFALTLNILDFDSVDVEFENVRFLRATTLSAKDEKILQIAIQKGTGIFEITESKNLVVSGTIRRLTENLQSTSTEPTSYKCDVLLTQTDFYKELKLRGYHYNGEFRSTLMASGDGKYGKIKWCNNWTTFMDCMLQLLIIQSDSRNLALPVKFRSMRIGSNYHKNRFGTEREIEAYSSENGIIAGGVEIIDLKTNFVQRKKPPGEPVLEKYVFIPYLNAPQISADDILRCCVQLFLENCSSTKFSIVQAVITSRDNLEFLSGLMQAINKLPILQGNYVLLNICNEEKLNKSLASNDSGIIYAETTDDLKDYINILLVDEAHIQTVLLTLAQRLSASCMLLIKITGKDIPEKTQLEKDFDPVALFPCLDRPYSILTLLRKSNNDYAEQLKNEQFIKISQYDEHFKWLDTVKHAIGKNIILVAENEPCNGLIGLVNCLRKEPHTSNVRCIFIEDDTAPNFDSTLPFYRNQINLGLAINIYRKGEWGSYRYLDLEPSQPITQHADHICGAIATIGDFSTIHWKKGQLRENDMKIRISYSALNFRDVMHASGRLSSEDIGLSRLEQSHILGLEYSGIDEKTGKAVMGMATHSAIASYMEPNSIISWEVPSRWSLKEAATVPVVYTTVYYAFFYTADIRNSKDILIHSGSGGVGIAAIRTALAYGLEVYTTVSTTEKKKFLLNSFPQLKEENIGNSRDCSFEEMIKKRTKGRGVDFVLNSLSEEKLKASLRCLAPHGCFLEIGKFDMANDSSVGLSVFFQGQKFYAILADKLSQYAPHLLKKLKTHIAEDIEKGIIQPLPSTIFKPSDLQQAFRYLMTAKHIGKVLIEIRPNVESLCTHPVSAMPKAYFNKEFVYIVLGGLGGFGLELVDWMILRGARKIVLNSRSGLKDQYQKQRISIWTGYKCQIKVNTSDITTETGCLDLLSESMKLGCVGGIFNLAVLLKDGIFSNQTVENFQQSFAPKAFATKYLDKLCQKLCPKLHYFVIFSSISCGRGNAGQTNYGMANSIMERIIEQRVKLGYPGKAIQWGAVGEVGLVAKMTEGKIDLNIGGTLQQRISSCLEVLDTLLMSPDPIVSSIVVAEKRKSANTQTAFQFVMNTLSFTKLQSVPAFSSLSELGMDSLTGVEIKQTLEKDFDIMLTPAELRALTIDRLRELSEIHKKKDVHNQLDDTTDRSVMNVLKTIFLNVSFKNLKKDLLLSLSNIDSSKVPVIIFPGVESVCSQAWEVISSQLEAPTYCAQLLASNDSEDIYKTAVRITKEIVKLLTSRNAKTFRIIAHSFGCFIAHIVAKLLEDLCFSGSLVYIDGSPAWVQNICGKLRTEDILNIKKELVLMTFRSTISKEKLENLISTVRDNENIEVIFWHIKHNLALKDVNERLNFLGTLIRNTEKILDLSAYKSIDILESKVLIIAPNKLLLPGVDEFFGLKPVIRNEINVRTVEGDHHSVLLNKQVPLLICNFFNCK